MEKQTSTSTLPLKGVRVLDFSTYAAAPICAMTLADWGADVIKIERITGDPLRLFGFIMQCPVQDDDNIVWEMDNRNKRGISLDIKTDKGKEIIHRLLDTADVLVTNYRPKALENLRLDYESVAEKYPRLIYAYLNGFGDLGPDKDKPGFDMSAFFARSGILIEMPEVGSPPVPPLAGFGDHPTGTILAGGICAALLQREKTGRGCKVQSALYNTALWALSLNIATANNNSEEEFLKIKPKREKPRTALMNTYRTKDDRWITVMALEYDRYWKPFSETVLGQPDLADDPRFSNQFAGFENAKDAVIIIDRVFGDLTCAEIVRRLNEADVSHEVNLHWREIKDDVQALDNGFILEHTMPSGRRDWIIGNPVRFNGERTPIRRNAPRLGEHNEEIFSELGYDSEEIAGLRKSNIIK